MRVPDGCQDSLLESWPNWVVTRFHPSLQGLIGLTHHSYRSSHLARTAVNIGLKVISIRVATNRLSRAKGTQVSSKTDIQKGQGWSPGVDQQAPDQRGQVGPWATIKVRPRRKDESQSKALSERTKETDRRYIRMS